MMNIKFKNLDEAFECYGRENLIPIDNLQQIIFYTKHGCQPRFIYENELKPGRISCWFLKWETKWVYQQFLDEQKGKGKDA